MKISETKFSSKNSNYSILIGLGAIKYLKKDGCFVAKVLDAGPGPEIQRLVNKKFEKVINFKPKASRSDSSERYLVAIGYKQ